MSCPQEINDYWFIVVITGFPCKEMCSNHYQSWVVMWHAILLGNENTHLHALAVIEQHVAELFGHHVQVSLLALVGSGQNIELGEVRGQIIERSKRREKTSLTQPQCWKQPFPCVIHIKTLTVWWWRRGRLQSGTQRGLLYNQTASSSLRAEAWKQTKEIPNTQFILAVLQKYAMSIFHNNDFM